MSFEIKETNTNHLEELQKQMKNIKVKVGLPKGKSGAYKDGLTVIEVAAKHEFGMGGMIERSFIRVPFQHNRNKVLAMMKKQAKKVFELEQTPENAMGLVGEYLRDKIKGSFTNNNWTPNSANTIATKGSSMPLVDTGQLRNSITWQIVKGK